MTKGNQKNTNITDLNKKRTPAERKAAAAKAGKASGEARRNYACMRECFRDRLTSEQMEKAFDKLWRLFINKGNLKAFDIIMNVIGEETSTTKNITITFASEEMEEYGD